MSTLSEQTRAPELADHVRLREMTDTTPIRWVISAGTDRYYRVGADLADLALALDGVRGVDDLCDHLGERWDRDRVVGGLGVLETMHVLDTPDDATEPPARRGRVRVIPPLTIQLSLIGPALQRILPGPRTRPVDPAHRRIRTGVVSAVSLLALACFAALVPTTLQVLENKVDLRVLALVVVVSVAATAVHEYAHAWALSRYGGRVSRVGVMLFYLIPAFFCDISDAWTLRSRRERVVVALAGGSVQATVFTATSIGGLVAIRSDASDVVVQTLVLLATTSLVMLLINLVPLVKLDGYIALMSATDIPNLRDKSISAFTARVRHVAFGTPVSPATHRWLPWFGGASVVLPCAMVYLAVSNWSGALAATGVVGDTIIMLLTCYLLFVAASAIRRCIARARVDGAQPARIVLACLTGSAIVLGLLAGAEVTRTASVSYLRVDGTTLLVSTDRATLDRIGDAREVTLLTNGLALHRDIGRGVTTGAVASAQFPLSAVLPTTSPGIITPGYALPLTAVVDPSAPDSGLAHVDVARTSLGRSLFDRFLWPSSLRGGVADLWRAVTR